MPTYEYECPLCGREFEAVTEMSKRFEGRCDHCDCHADLIISAFNTSIFTPFVCENFGVDPVPIESKHQLREENKKRGLETIM